MQLLSGAFLLCSIYASSRINYYPACQIGYKSVDGKYVFETSVILNYEAPGFYKSFAQTDMYGRINYSSPMYNWVMTPEDVFAMISVCLMKVAEKQADETKKDFEILGLEVFPTRGKSVKIVSVHPVSSLLVFFDSPEKVADFLSFFENAKNELGQSNFEEIR